MTKATAVIIAAFNAEATLERAARSALSQPDVAEICIVDDCSTDGTRRVAEELAKTDARVSLRVAERNAGPSTARNVAIAATTAPWITILDADDYMLTGRIAALHAVADGADFIADALLRVPGDAPPPATSTNLSPVPLSFTGFVLGNLGARSGPLDLGYLKPLMRRDFLAQHSLRYRDDMRLGEDYELYARALALGGRFFTCEAAGYISVERNGSLSKVHSEDDLQRLRDCDDALAAIGPLGSDERRALKRHWHSVDCRLQWRRLITAVKKHDLAAAASTFHTPQAAAFLAARLAEQAWLRGMSFVRGDSALSAPSRAYPQ